MSKPSPGAMRAAEKVRQIYGWPVDDLEVEHIGLVIDQETGLPELVEALHGVYSLFGHLLTENSPPETNAEIIRERRERIGKLLLKAEGREGA